jgi:very-short-patch-repair endonuclease
MRDRLTIRRARELRSRLTDAERRLWYLLRRNHLGCHFKRQYPIGPYFADFACVRLRLVIEIDGGQHADQSEYDATRDQFIRAQGFEVFRIWSNEALQQTDAVLAAIQRAVADRKPPPP